MSKIFNRFKNLKTINGGVKLNSTSGLQVTGGLTTVTPYSTTGLSLVSNAYIGAVYSSNQNRIYYIPYAISNQSTWHYFDCALNTIVQYSNGLTLAQFAFCSGCINPTTNLIYMAPYSISNTTTWYYINCSTASPGSGVVTITSYTGIAANQNAYQDAEYDSVNNRVFFIPGSNQSLSSTWHYINSAGAAASYTNGSSGASNTNTNTFGYGFSPAAYSVTQQVIMLNIFATNLTTKTAWFYINTASATTPVVTSYSPVTTNNSTVNGAGAYVGAVLHTQLNRIYFVPGTMTSSYGLHYYDCALGSIVTYANPLTSTAMSYQGGVYAANLGIIAFVPFTANASNLYWAYIDRYGTMQRYTPNLTLNTVASSAYQLGASDGDNIYFAPYGQGNSSVWHILSMTGLTISNNSKEALSLTNAPNAFTCGIRIKKNTTCTYATATNTSNQITIQPSNGSFSYILTAPSAPTSTNVDTLVDPGNNNAYLVITPGVYTFNGQLTFSSIPPVLSMNDISYTWIGNTTVTSTTSTLAKLTGGTTTVGNTYGTISHTSPNRITFTDPVSRPYRVTFNGSINCAATETVTLAFFKNATTQITSSTAVAHVVGAIDTTCAISCQQTFVSGDFIELWCKTSSGTSTFISYGCVTAISL